MVSVVAAKGSGGARGRRERGVLASFEPHYLKGSPGGGDGDAEDEDGCEEPVSHRVVEGVKDAVHSLAAITCFETNDARKEQQRQSSQDAKDQASNVRHLLLCTQRSRNPTKMPEPPFGEERAGEEDERQGRSWDEELLRSEVSTCQREQRRRRTRWAAPTCEMKTTVG